MEKNKSRAERREIERRRKAMWRWVNGLTEDQKRIIEVLSEEKATEMISGEIALISDNINSCLAASLYSLKDYSKEEVYEIIELMNEFAVEGQEFLLEHRGDYDMKINEIKPKIKERSLELLDDNKNQKVGVEALKLEFKEIPLKDLVIIWKEAKKEWMIPTVEVEESLIPKAEPTIRATEKLTTDKMLSDSERAIEDKSKIYKARVESNKEKNKEKVVNKMEDNKKAASKLVIKSKEFKMEIEGEYGEYRYTNLGVQSGELKFADLQAVEKYKQEELKKFNALMEEIKTVFAIEV